MKERLENCEGIELEICKLFGEITLVLKLLEL